MFHIAYSIFKKSMPLLVEVDIQKVDDWQKGRIDCNIEGLGYQTANF